MVYSTYGTSVDLVQSNLWVLQHRLQQILSQISAHGQAGGYSITGAEGAGGRVTITGMGGAGGRISIMGTRDAGERVSIIGAGGAGGSQ